MASMVLNPAGAFKTVSPAPGRWLPVSAERFRPEPTSCTDVVSAPTIRLALPLGNLAPPLGNVNPSNPVAVQAAAVQAVVPQAIESQAAASQAAAAFQTARPGDPGRVAHAADQAYLAALAVRCAGGDNAAWETLVRREGRRVYGLCYRFTGSPTDAEDLTQDVFLKVYRNLGSFDPARASFGVWLTVLTRNLLVDRYRRSRLERATDSLDEPLGDEREGETRADRLPDPGAGQEQHVAGLELRARVQAALARVTPELREAVILRDLQDLDYREIADVLGIPQGTVKSRISRGRAELARLLDGEKGQVA